MLCYDRLDHSTKAVEVLTVGRMWRVEFPVAIHHMTAQAVAGQDMFSVDGDRLKFLSLPADLRQRWGMVFHGYCLMGKHSPNTARTTDA